MVVEGHLTRDGSLSHTPAGPREARAIGTARASWLEERVHEDICRPPGTDLRAAVRTIAERLLVEDLTEGLTGRVQERALSESR